MHFTFGGTPSHCAGVSDLRSLPDVGAPSSEAAPGAPSSESRVGDQSPGSVGTSGDDGTIVGTSGDMDPCLLPDAKGYRSMIRHMMGISDATRQQLRSEALSTQLNHFREFGAILEEISTTPLAQVILCSEETGRAFAQKWGGSEPVFTVI